MVIICGIFDTHPLPVVFILFILLTCYSSTIFNIAVTNSYLRKTSHQQKRRDALLVEAKCRMGGGVCICALVVITRLKIYAIF